MSPKFDAWALIERMPFGLAVCQVVPEVLGPGALRITWSNSAAARVLGEPASHDGHPVLTGVTPSARARITTVAKGEHGDGEPIEIRGHAWTIVALDETTVALICTTDARKAQSQSASTDEQLRQAQKLEAIGRLAAGVAHDFNNLLTTILGQTELTIDALSPEDPRRAEVEVVRDAGRRGAQLTRQLLAFARRQVLRTRVLDVDDVLRGLEPLLSRLIGEHIELSIFRDKNLQRIRADRGQFEQVVVNLVLNARDSMPQGGKLSIEVTNVARGAVDATLHVDGRAGPHVMIVVRDTGSGMDARTQAHMFEPFFTTKPEGCGTGLGLATVFGIVEQGGGSIAVESEPGRGSAFKIYLPATRERPTAEVRVAQHTMDGDESVLLVEDDDAVRSIATEILRRRGYRVLAARSADEAHALLRGIDRLDLLITDVVMPGIGGRRLAEQIRAARGDVRVLFMSGYSDRGPKEDGSLDDQVEFVQKPLTPDLLARRVREVLDAG